MQNIYFFIGTKAQAIKCISLIEYMSRFEYLNLFIVNSGQHIEITENIFERTGDNVQSIFLNSNKNNISKYFLGVKWFCKILFKIFTSKKLNNINNKDICFVHGDTASTLLGLLWSKRNKLTTIHLESGLSSDNIFNPFPEEIIRNFVTKFSDILITFDENSAEKLIYKYKNKHVIQISENTIFEELKNIKNTTTKEKNKVSVTLHRTENILSKKRMKSFVELLNILSKKHEINWFCHEPTLNSIDRFNLKIDQSINLKPLLEHNLFLTEVMESKIVITDGGSIQEECYYLNKLTILWRKKTERPYALNSNIFLSNFDIEKSVKFIEKTLLNKKKHHLIDATPVIEIYESLTSLEILNTNK